MKIWVEMDYLTTDRQSGKYKYRRRVPQELVAAVGKREFSISLRTSDAAEATRKYPDVHRRVEQQIRQAAITDPEQIDFKRLLEFAKSQGMVPPNVRSSAPLSVADGPEEEHLRAIISEWEASGINPYDDSGVPDWMSDALLKRARVVVDGAKPLER